MAPLYADENCPGPVVDALPALGHDILTAHEDGRAGQSVPDPDVLARATALGRAVLTDNRWDYVRLHAADPSHSGIVVFTRDSNFPATATRIHAAMAVALTLTGRMPRVNRPNRPNPPKVP